MTKTLHSRSPRLLLLALAFTLAAGCKSPRGADKSTPSTQSAKDETRALAHAVVNLSASEFRKLYAEKGGTLLDVRTPQEVAEAHLTGASVVNSADPKFESKVNSISKDKPIFVYCHSGGRSGRATQLLATLGFKEIYNLEGGIMAWKRAKLPVESSPLKERRPKASEVTRREFARLLEENAVVLVDYHTEWCTPCREMTPIIDKVAKIYEGKALVLRIDIDQSEALSLQEKIQGVPVFVLYEKGKESWRHSGLISQKDLEAKLARFLKE